MIIKIAKNRLFCSFCTSPKPLSPYKILQVQQNATQQQIKSKYYELAQKYHPDHDPTYTQRFKVINEAYQILKDAQKRKELDYQLLNKSNLSVKYDFSRTYKHHYGHTATKQNFNREELQILRRRAAEFSKKPDYGTSNPGSYFDFGLNLNKNKKDQKKRSNARVKEKQQTIKSIFIGGIVLLALFGVVQLIFKVYQFNTKSHKSDQQTLKKSKRIKDL